MEATEHYAPDTGQKDKVFTAGPVLTTAAVKRAMCEDVETRTDRMRGVYKFIRSKLLEIAGVSEEHYTCVLLQGCGTYTTEAIFNCTRREDSRVLILDNGFYGRVMAEICQRMGVEFHAMGVPEDQAITGDLVREFLEGDSRWTAVGVVHHETTTGMLNHLEEVGKVVKEKCPDSILITDCISSFGAVPIDFERAGIDFLVCVPNKCLQSPPGFGFTICRKDRLLECKGRSTSVCLDLYDQYQSFENPGHFTMTPPTNSLNAFRQALFELEAEGGVTGRMTRFRDLNRILVEGTDKLGFKRFVSGPDASYNITAYLFPQHPNWDYETFRKGLLDLGQVLSPVARLQTCTAFRIGNMGALCQNDIRKLLECIEVVLTNMGIPVPVR